MDFSAKTDSEAIGRDEDLSKSVEIKSFRRGKVNGKKTVSPLITSDNFGYNQKASRRGKVKGKDDAVGSTEETLSDCC